MKYKRVVYVKAFLSPESAVPFVWIAESSKCLRNEEDMEFFSKASAEQHKSGVISFTQHSNHRKFGRSIRAFVVQRTSYKCKWRIDGAQNMFGASLFRRHNPTPLHTKILLERLNRLDGKNKA